MGFGKTYWHGPIVKRQDSYGPEEGKVIPRFDEAAWEATAAWEAKRWQLNREGTEFLKAHGAEFKRDGTLREDVGALVAPKVSDEDLLLIAAILIAME